MAESVEQTQQPGAQQAVPRPAEGAEGEALIHVVVKMVMPPAAAQPALAARFGLMQMEMDDLLGQVALMKPQTANTPCLSGSDLGEWLAYRRR